MGLSQAGAQLYAETRWVLLVEDDPEIRKIIRESLIAELAAERLGVDLQIVEASDGREALSQATQQRFHCVITDLQMPRATGDEFIRAMQSHPLNANTPTLVVSAFARDKFREFCERFSHIKIITKPFVPQNLAQIVMREIKLGRMDDRVSIHLMNPFLESIQEFMRENLRLSPEVLNPAVKKADEALNGDYHVTLDITTGVSRAVFSLSFDRDLLDYAKPNFLQDKLPQWVGMEPDSVARYLASTLFDLTTPQIQIRMGGAPRLAGISVISPETEGPYKELMQSTGVTVTVRSTRGRICAGAFSLAKTKRN